MQKYKLNAKLNLFGIFYRLNLSFFDRTANFYGSKIKTFFNYFLINVLIFKSKLINIKSKSGKKWELLEIFI
ncbi:hypothetical protein HY04_06140 [Kaistella antarctica]|uniref:Uncharacterized protein n=1 Tax=Kaistella antarctica TaxID=266748 RepID=A0ABR4TVV6_9FLAO|nr:hypothetical protein HY04_06140 [Kaistella antarctica]